MRPLLNRSSYTVVLLAAGLALVASACGTTDDGSSLFPGVGGDDGGLSGPSNGPGTFSNLDASQAPDAIYANDPPPQWCGPETGASSAPAPITGTTTCPSDKNLEGCPCPESGATAACWPGLRKNRDVGVCKDGIATCTKQGELSTVWGPCVGAVLPDPNGATPADKCDCFSEGQWNIENLVPFFATYTSASNVSTTYGISTYQDPTTGTTTFPTYPQTPPPPMPTQDWSKDDLKVDCAGTFTLCYELKAGDFSNPQPSDCSVTKVCLPSTFYPTANVDQAFPNLGPWLADASHSACSEAFHTVGGYGEMSVLGQTVMCDAIDDGSGGSLVFHRIQYCAAQCSDPANASTPACANCGQDGSGSFK